MALGAQICSFGAAETPNLHFTNLAGGGLRIYSHLLEPREHPDYERRAVKPPSGDAFKNQTRFTCLRGFNVEQGRLVGFVEELDKFTEQHELGEVI